MFYRVFPQQHQGKLLTLAPWEHHNKRKKITAEQCQQMNLMALEICRNK